MRETIQHRNKKPKGKIKIELFENGNKVKEQNDTNFIAKGVGGIMDLLGYDLLFAEKASGKPRYSNNIGTVFGRMLLSSASHAESPESEFYFRGNLIGFGDSRISGNSASNLLQGAYNSLESSQNRDRVRVVFDFGNNYANGTFNSIYFGNSTNLYTVTGDSSFPPGGTSVYGSNDIKMVKVLNGTHYVLRTNGVFDVFNQNLELVETHSYPNPTIVSDFEIVGDYVYFSSRSTSLSIRRARLDNLGELETVAVPNGVGLGGITYNTRDNNFYVCNDAQLFVYNSQFSLLNTVDLRYRVNILFTAMTYLERSNEIIFNNLVYNIDDNEFGTWYSPITGVDGSASLYLCTGLFNEDNIFFSTNASVLPLASIGSRSLLDAPITKTENQTMKITYDFIVE